MCGQVSLDTKPGQRCYGICSARIATTSVSEETRGGLTTTCVFAVQKFVVLLWPQNRFNILVSYLGNGAVDIRPPLVAMVAVALYPRRPVRAGTCLTKIWQTHGQNKPVPGMKRRGSARPGALNLYKRAKSYPFVILFCTRARETTNSHLPGEALCAV